ncbi:MAG: hypothetical protein ACEPOW_13980 [Bacteroidales bacterium]
MSGNKNKESELNLGSVTCCCGKTICDDNIDYSNGCNELGEDIHNINADCDCGKDYEINGWGEIESLAEAKEELVDYIKEL